MSMFARRSFAARTRSVAVDTAAACGARVSVVVPCYNYARYLPDTVASILSQPGVELEVIIVDDRSSDESVQVARALALKDDRIVVIEHRVNRGHIATYNEGLARATGDFIVLLSADDALAPGSLQRAVALMTAQPTIGFVYGLVERFSEAIPESSVGQVHADYRMWAGVDWLSRRCLLVTNCVVSPEVVMRREVYELVGPYDSTLPHTGDMAMWMRAAAVSDVGYVAGPPAAYYRQHNTNMHKSMFLSGQVDGMLVDLDQRKLTIEAVFDGPASELAEGARLLATAKRSLAAEALAAAARAYTWGLSQSWPVAGMIDYAKALWPDYERLSQWRAVRRRQSLGTRWSRRNPFFVATELVIDSRRRANERFQKSTGA